MFILFLIVFIDLVGFGLIIPLLPFYAEHFNAAPFTVGLVMATYSLTQFISAPFWGRMSDHIGRRPVLLVSMAGASLSYVALGFADSLWILFVARAFGGFMAGNIATAFAYMADITTRENRTKGMGIIGAAFGLGFIAGPAIGGILAGPDPLNADYQTPAFAAAAFSLIAMSLGLVMLKESLSAETRAKQARLSRKSRRQQFSEALTQPQVGKFIGIGFLVIFVFAGVETTFAMWSRRQFGWGPEHNGYMFAMLGLVSAVIQGGLVGRLARRFGERQLVLSGAVMFSTGLFLIPLSTTLAALAVAMLLLAVGFSIMTPSLNSLISLQVSDAAQGGVMGVTRSATTMARIVGPAWAGMLFSLMGKDWPYVVGGLIMASVVWFIFRHLKPDQPATNAAPNQPAAGAAPNQPAAGAAPNQPAASAAPNQPAASAAPNQED